MRPDIGTLEDQISAAAEAEALGSLDAPFLTDAPCRKCGALDPALKWVSALVSRPGYELTVVDWLRVKCWRCGFTWVARPKDAEERAVADACRAVDTAFRQR
jgi:hypothetical protein